MPKKEKRLYAMVDLEGEFIASDDGRLFVYDDPSFARADAKSCGYKLVEIEPLRLARKGGKGVRGS